MTPVLVCPDEAALWPAADELPLQAAAELHVAGCAVCRRRIERLRRERMALRQWSAESRSGRDDRPMDDESSPAPAGGDDSPPPRDTIGRYPILEPLGGGGQGEVYRGLHPTLGCRVILKLSRERLEVDDAARTAILQEGRILAAVEDPRLARVIDLDFHDDRPFLVLEEVEGEPLSEVLQRGRLTLRCAADLVRRLAEAVQSAHRAGVLHLDLKPDNVLLTPGGEPRLIDFGIAVLQRACSGSTAAGWVTGTPAYMAPEQQTGDPQRLTERSDVYGLGGILHCLLYGRPPQDADADPPAAAPVDDASSSVAPDAPGQAALPRSREWLRVQRVCRRALARAPEERYQSAAELAEALAAAVSPPGRPCLRIAAGVALLLSGAVSLFAAVGWSDAETLDSAAMTLAASVVIDGGESPLAAGDALPRGAALRVRAVSPRPEQTRMFILRGDGRVLSCHPLVGETNRQGEVQFPADGSAWRIDGLPEFNLLLVGMTRSRPPPGPAEVEEHLRRAGVLLGRIIDGLVLSETRTDPGRAFGSGARDSEHSADASTAAAHELCEALDGLFDRYTGIVLRCEPRPTVPDVAPSVQSNQTAL